MWVSFLLILIFSLRLLVIVSHILLEDKEGQMKLSKAEIFKQPWWMIQSDGQHKDYPKRTFSGDKYNVEFSNHLSVLVYLVKEVKS